MCEHLLAVAIQVFGVDDGLFNIIFAEQIGQCLLALNLWKPTQVSITPEQVEGVIDQPVLPACRQLCLKFGEVGPPLVDHHNFPVDDGLAGDIEAPARTENRLV